MQNNANLHISHLKYEFSNVSKAITEPCTTSVNVDTKYAYIVLVLLLNTSE